MYWYHDHTIGITRLNVYAGLAGLYEIQDPPSVKSLAEKNIATRYGNVSKKYLAITDKSFHTNGSLGYPHEAASSEFTSWKPESFGNMITVNGKVWPKLSLEKKVYRFVILNACNARYLNIFFLAGTEKISFLLLRLENDFFPKAL